MTAHAGFERASYVTSVDVNRTARRWRSRGVFTFAVLAVAAAGTLGVHKLTEARARGDLWQSRWEHLRSDPAGLGRYASDNAALRAHGIVPGRVVFLGASVTEGLDLARLFPNAPYVNRGVSGQLVWQEYLRLPDDALALSPTAIVPEVCASNFESNAPPLEQTEALVARLADDARARGVRPVLATVLPVSRGYAHAQNPWPIAQRIDAMNHWLRAYAAAHGDALIDWNAAVADRDGFLPDALTADGLHPNAQGQARMADAARTTLVSHGL